MCFFSHIMLSTLLIFFYSIGVLKFCMPSKVRGCAIIRSASQLCMRNRPEEFAIRALLME